MNGIGIISLTEIVQKINVTQYWYADDGSAAGDLKNFRAKLENLDVDGKAFGYNVKTSKCQLRLKENCHKCTIKLFEPTNFTMVDGFGVLGLVITTSSACDKYIEDENKITTPFKKAFQNS